MSNVYDTRAWKYSFAIPSRLYAQICCIAKETFLKLEPDTNVIVNTGVDSQDGRCVFSIRYDQEVHTIVGGRRYGKHLYLGMSSRKDIIGDGFLVINFTRDWFKTEATMFFEFYSFLIRDDIDRIFGPFEWEKVDFNEQVQCQRG